MKFTKLRGKESLQLCDSKCVNISQNILLIISDVIKFKTDMSVLSF